MLNIGPNIVSAPLVLGVLLAPAIGGMLLLLWRWRHKPLWLNLLNAFVLVMYMGALLTAFYAAFACVTTAQLKSMGPPAYTCDGFGMSFAIWAPILSNTLMLLVPLVFIIELLCAVRRRQSVKEAFLSPAFLMVLLFLLLYSLAGSMRY